MAYICAHCKSAEVGHGFNLFQCYTCGGFTTYTGQPSVPTSALEVGGTFEGPGAELIADPDTAPFPARAKEIAP